MYGVQGHSRAIRSTQTIFLIHGWEEKEAFKTVTLWAGNDNRPSSYTNVLNITCVRCWLSGWSEDQVWQTSAPETLRAPHWDATIGLESATILRSPGLVIVFLYLPWKFSSRFNYLLTCCIRIWFAVQGAGEAPGALRRLLYFQVGRESPVLGLTWACIAWIKYSIALCVLYS